MRKRVMLLSLIILGLFVVGIYQYLIGTNKNKLTNRHKVAFILKTNVGYYWGTMKQGADAAAREFNIELDYNAPNDEGNVDEQVRMMDHAIDNKVSAIILAPNDDQRLKEVTERAVSRNIPVVMIDSEVATNKASGYIATDYLEAGKKIGSALAALVGPNTGVGVIGYVNQRKNIQLREGLQSVIRQYTEIHIISDNDVSPNGRQAYLFTKELLQQKGKALQALVALNSNVAEEVAEAVNELNLKGTIKVVSFDSTPKIIDDMENGVIQSIITQNPFSIGYLSVKKSIEVVENKRGAKPIYTETKIVNMENMYYPENQKILFPFVK